MIGRLVIDDFFNPVPLRPTVFFYLGFLPLLPLLWVWRDSAYYETSKTGLLTPDYGYFIGLEHSRLQIGLFTILNPSPPKIPGVSLPDPVFFSRIDFTKQRSRLELREFFTSFRFEKGEEHNLHYRVISTPFWFLCVCYLAPWLEISYKLARKKRDYFLSTLPPQEHTD